MNSMSIGVVVRRTALALTLILTLLSTTMAGTVFVSVVIANPFLGFDWITADADTNPPSISILFPENNSVHNVNNMSVNLNVTIGESKTASSLRIMDIYYEADWQKGNTSLYHNAGIYIPTDPYSITEFSSVLNFTELSDGKHTITFHAVEWGAYLEEPYVHMFSINSSSSFNFTIDVVSPNISVLSPLSKTYDISDVPLSFAIDESVSQFSYVLDGVKNVTIDGNGTLTKLVNGDHNLTLFATDEAGNVGASETVYFTVDAPEPFPTVAVAAVSVVSAGVAVAGVCLLFYRKRKNRNR
jgi:hypothetical protein